MPPLFRLKFTFQGLFQEVQASKLQKITKRNVSNVSNKKKPFCHLTFTFQRSVSRDSGGSSVKATKKYKRNISSVPNKIFHHFTRIYFPSRVRFKRSQCKATKNKQKGTLAVFLITKNISPPKIYLPKTVSSRS